MYRNTKKARETKKLFTSKSIRVVVFNMEEANRALVVSSLGAPFTPQAVERTFDIFATPAGLTPTVVLLGSASERSSAATNPSEVVHEYELNLDTKYYTAKILLWLTHADKFSAPHFIPDDNSLDVYGEACQALLLIFDQTEVMMQFFFQFL